MSRATSVDVESSMSGHSQAYDYKEQDNVYGINQPRQLHPPPVQVRTDLSLEDHFEPPQYGTPGQDWAYPMEQWQSLSHDGTVVYNGSQSTMSMKSLDRR